jgi:methionyl-tRNA formyltransferase
MDTARSRTGPDMTDAPALTLFAMTQKGLDVARALFEHHPGLVATVVTARDASVAKDYRDEIAALCGAAGVPCFDRNDAFTLGTPYAFAIGWRWLIATSTSRLVVFHDSLLPRFRGFNPLVSALLNGESRLGVTALFASEEYDRGDVIAQASCDIAYPMLVRDAIDRLVPLYQRLAVDIAGHIRRGDALVGTPQDEATASYSLWRDEEDYRLDWTRSAGELRRHVDAVGFPYQGASTLVDGKLARILRAQDLPDVRVENRVPGKVIFVSDGVPVVVCGHGLLRVHSLVDDATKASLLPLRRFRTRFT